MPHIILVHIERTHAVLPVQREELAVQVASSYLAVLKGRNAHGSGRVGIVLLTSEPLLDSYWVYGFLYETLAKHRQRTQTDVIPALRIVIYSLVERNAAAVGDAMRWLME